MKKYASWITKNNDLVVKKNKSALLLERFYFIIGLIIIQVVVFYVLSNLNPNKATISIFLIILTGSTVLLSIYLIFGKNIDLKCRKENNRIIINNKSFGDITQLESINLEEYVSSDFVKSGNDIYFKFIDKKVVLLRGVNEHDAFLIVDILKKFINNENINVNKYVY